MRKALLIAAREYNAAVRTKGFIIGLIVLPLFMGGSGIVIALTKNRVDPTPKRIAAVDHTQRLQSDLLVAVERRNAEEIRDPESGELTRTPYELLIVAAEPDSPRRLRLELSDQVRAGDLDAFLEIGGKILDPPPATAMPENADESTLTDPSQYRITYHAENAVMDESILGWLQQQLNFQLRQLRLSDAGVAPEEVSALLRWSPVQGLGLFDHDTESGAVKDPERSSEVRSILVPLAMMFLLFLLTMMGAAPMMNTMMEEKSQKIAEVLLGSATPFQIMLGKLIGGVGIALTGAAIYLIGGGITLAMLGHGDFIPLDVLPWWLAYLLAAILIYGALFGALGSACSDPKESQSLMMPAWFLMMVPMITNMPVLMNPTATFAVVLSLIPPFTPFVMLLRQASPTGIPAWQPIAGLISVLLGTVAIVWIGGRIFRVGLLMQGKPPRLADLLRWAVRG